MPTTGYGQFCPVAKAAEILDQRWTLLVLRELFAGSQHFNEVRRGVPKMSPTLLSRRLRQLTRAGVVVRTADGRYVLTDAGLELRPVIEALGAWGSRWIHEIGDPDLDPHLLCWDLHRRVDLSALPPGRTVLHFAFRNIPAKSRHWWLVMTRDGVDVCEVDPGHEVAVTVDADLRELSRVWRGDQTWAQALSGGGIELVGSTEHRRALPQWFQLGVFASVPRPAGAAAIALD